MVEDTKGEFVIPRRGKKAPEECTCWHSTNRCSRVCNRDKINVLYLMLLIFANNFNFGVISFSRSKHHGFASVMTIWYTDWSKISKWLSNNRSVIRLSTLYSAQFKDCQSTHKESRKSSWKEKQCSVFLEYERVWNTVLTMTEKLTSLF